MKDRRIAGKRLTESGIGMLLAVLLALLWLVSMPVADGHASSFFPAGWGLIALIAMAFIAIAAGYKVVRLSLTGWVGIGIGVYFLIRCMHSPSVVDAWYETGLLSGAFVFYLAGIYAAQSAGTRVLVLVVSACILLNAAAWWLMEEGELSIRFIGRPEMSLVGENSRNVTLLVYKNAAALLLSVCGGLLIWWALWRAVMDGKALVVSAVGVAGIVCSFFCESRVVLLMLPVLGIVGGFLWIFMTLYRKKSLSGGQILCSWVLMVLVAAFAVDCFFGHRFFDFIFGIDSHQRFRIWSEAWRLVGDAPWCGYGAAAAQWVMSIAYDGGNLPNYVHNEYLQVWLDYGAVGVLLLFAFLVVHLAHGLRGIASEHTDGARKVKYAMAAMCVLGMCAAAFTDYVWHNFSLVGMAAFASGVLASPFPHTPLRLFDFRNWAPECSRSVRPLRAESGVRKLIMLAVLSAGGLIIGGLCKRLYAGWNAQWEYDAMVHSGASAEQRRAFLAGVVSRYPDSGIADHYALLGAGYMDWPMYEQVLRTVLHGNPQQYFAAAMLADTLGRQQKFAEAEAVFRHYYPKDGPDNTPLYSWAVYYATNLFAWAEQLIADGQKEKAFSMMSAAEKIMQSGRRPAMYPHQNYRSDARNWVNGGSAHRRMFISNCKTDLMLLKVIGITPDHSWQAPLEPGGKPALYRRYLHD